MTRAPNFKDEMGNRYGRLVVVAFAGTRQRGHRTEAQWRCQCDCGNIVNLSGHVLRNGNTRSCGCLHIEHASRIGHANRQHGCAGAGVTPEYYAWTSMRSRCANPRNASYAAYGGRGISVCREWNRSFESFLDHVGPRPSPKHSLDRINVNGNYEPGNVRWATAKQQTKNRRITVISGGRVGPELSETICEPASPRHRRIASRRWPSVVWGLCEIGTMLCRSQMTPAIHAERNDSPQAPNRRSLSALPTIERKHW
jgi:hypothetical protein